MAIMNPDHRLDLIPGAAVSGLFVGCCQLLPAADCRVPATRTTANPSLRHHCNGVRRPQKRPITPHRGDCSGPSPARLRSLWRSGCSNVSLALRRHDTAPLGGARRRPPPRKQARMLLVAANRVPPIASFGPAPFSLGARSVTPSLRLAPASSRVDACRHVCPLPHAGSRAECGSADTAAQSLGPTAAVEQERLLRLAQPRKLGLPRRHHMQALCQQGVLCLDGGLQFGDLRGVPGSR